MLLIDIAAVFDVAKYNQTLPAGIADWDFYLQCAANGVPLFASIYIYMRRLIVHSCGAILSASTWSGSASTHPCRIGSACLSASQILGRCPSFFEEMLSFRNRFRTPSVHPADRHWWWTREPWGTEGCSVSLGVRAPSPRSA
jgi:hypothetical protein